jgi:hypothetical protein
LALVSAGIALMRTVRAPRGLLSSVVMMWFASDRDIVDATETE